MKRKTNLSTAALNCWAGFLGMRVRDMERILLAMFLILSVTIAFGQAAFGQSETEKGSSAQDVMIKSEVEPAGGFP